VLCEQGVGSAGREWRWRRVVALIMWHCVLLECAIGGVQRRGRVLIGRSWVSALVMVEVLACSCVMQVREYTISQRARPSGFASGARVGQGGLRSDDRVAHREERASARPRAAPARKGGDPARGGRVRAGRAPVARSHHVRGAGGRCSSFLAPASCLQCHAPKTHSSSAQSVATRVDAHARASSECANHPLCRSRQLKSRDQPQRCRDCHGGASRGSTVT